MPVKVFSIPQVTKLVAPDSSGKGVSALSNFPLSNTPISVVKGVLNEVLFLIKDVDSHPAYLPYDTLTINIVDPVVDLLLLQRNLVPVDYRKSLYKLVITAADTTDWLIGSLRWSVTDTRQDGNTVLLWADMNYGTYGSLNVVEGPVPPPRPPLTLDPQTFLLLDFASYSSALPGAAQAGYPAGVQTAALYLDNFTGTVTVQASLLAQPQQETDWFEAAVQTYVSQTGVTSITLTQSALWFRIVIGLNDPIQPTGNISKILYSY